MSEALRAYRSAFHSLEMVVADGRCRLQTCGNICVMNDVALFGAMRPYTGEAIRLEFKVNGERVSLRRVLAREMSHLLLDAKNILHMMTELVRNDIGLCELRIAPTETL